MNRCWTIVLALLIDLLVSVSTLGAGVDFTLGIFGNANMDDTIDENDISYVEGVIKGTNEATNLSDANYDGKIDAQDIDQIKDIIRGDETGLTIVDSAYRIVTVKKPVKRMVVLQNFIFETIPILGALDETVGITPFIKKTIYHPAVNTIQIVETKDYETILGLNPDLIVDSVTRATESAENIPSIPVVGLNFNKPEIIREEITKLGYILDREDAAKHYVKDLHEMYVDSIKEKTKDLPDDERPNAYVEAYSSPYQHYGLGTVYECGGHDIFADLPPGTTIDPEEVIVRDPDIIIKKANSGTDSGYEIDDISKMQALRDEIMNRPELANVTAVKTGNVYVIDGQLSYGPDHLIVMQYYAKWLHPDIFKDLDPQAIHQEYLIEFQHLDFDLNEHGVFVYPPLNEN